MGSACGRRLAGAVPPTCILAPNIVIFHRKNGCAGSMSSDQSGCSDKWVVHRTILRPNQAISPDIQKSFRLSGGRDDTSGRLLSTLARTSTPALGIR